MPATEFSKDEFEDFLLDDVRHRWGTGTLHLKPSRMLKNRLAYDFAVYTRYGVFARPGVRIDDPRAAGLNAIQAAALSPGRFTSALVRFKVPFFVTQRREPNTA